MRALLLPIGAELLAVPLMATREIVTAPAVTPIATAPPAVLGLFVVRGDVVPLFDAATLLGLGGPTRARYAAVLECAGGIAGLAMTAAPSIVQVDEGDLRPATLPGTAGIVPVRGPGRAEGLVAAVLDLDEVFLAAGAPPAVAVPS